jgi:hypothetical protein
MAVTGVAMGEYNRDSHNQQRDTNMGLDRVPSGKSLPNDFNVIIEIPMHADPVKYEVDKESGAGLRRSLHVHRHALPVQLRLHPAHHRR